MANGISINYRREQAGLIAQNLVTGPTPGPPRSQHACLRRSNLGEARKDLSLAGEKLDRAKAETESVQAKLVELQAAAGVEATKSAELSKRLQAKLQEAQTEAGVLRKRMASSKTGSPWPSAGNAPRVKRQKISKQPQAALQEPQTEAGTLRKRVGQLEGELDQAIRKGTLGRCEGGFRGSTCAPDHEGRGAELRDQRVQPVQGDCPHACVVVEANGRNVLQPPPDRMQRHRR